MLGATISPESQTLAASVKSPQEESDRIFVRINTKRFTPTWWKDVIVFILCIIFIPAGTVLVVARIIIDKRNKVPITIGGIVWRFSRSLTHEKREILAQLASEELPAQHARKEPSSNLEPAPEAEVQSDTGIELPKKKSMEEFNLSWARGVALRMLEKNLDPTGPPIGIPNYGNSCYLNTAIQCAYHHNFLRMLVHVLGKIFPPTSPGGDMRECLIEVFNCLEKGTPWTRESFEKFKNALAHRNPTFADSAQHCSHECLIAMLDGLEIDKMRYDYVNDTIEAAFLGGKISEEDLALLILSGIYKNKQLNCAYGLCYEVPEVVGLSYNFGGMSHVAVEYFPCKHLAPSWQSEPNIGLARKNSLAEAIDWHEREELLQGDDQLYCAECKELRDATRVCTLKDFGIFRNFFIKRFAELERGKIEKENGPIEFPQKLTLHGITYQLCFFGSHIGTTANYGHYVSYVRRGGKWYMISDSSVTEVELGELIRSNEVMYMTYRRVP
ncbi:MAG: ubiquitin carboxyl-terminal hydrolase [Puniceicoccales bacterium]|jgi:ubiquitin C-terminal hydrolase|nr:ubiquitin carboxyl-terminal hydrolase [Puniceicoccales bacterium]